jgi:hypothetical protein
MWAVATLIFGLLSGCGGRHSPVGFRLPEDGDIERGRAAFVELQCHKCHTVVGTTLAVPHQVDLGPIPLGGEVREIRTDGFLVTSIIHPGHIRARGPREVTLTPDGESRMPDYTDEMTVRQLVDIVAFLQWKYKFVPGPSPYAVP